MTPLSVLLAVKIAGTLLFIAGPFLFLSKARLEAVTGMTAASPALFRLYGVAMLALVVAYASGVHAAQAGRFPWGIVAMGLVSNAGAVVVMIASGTVMRQRAMAAFLASVAAGLVVFALFPNLGTATP